MLTSWSVNFEALSSSKTAVKKWITARFKSWQRHRRKLETAEITRTRQQLSELPCPIHHQNRLATLLMGIPAQLNSKTLQLANVHSRKRGETIPSCNCITLPCGAVGTPSTAFFARYTMHPSRLEKRCINPHHTVYLAKKWAEGR